MAVLDRAPSVTCCLEKLTRGLFGTSVLLRRGGDTSSREKADDVG